MGNRVEGKVAIVTGGSRGQGASHGEHLAREGATVVLTDILDELGEAEAARQRALGLPVEYLHLDVTSRAGWEATIADVEARHGKVDVLVNNAGLATFSSCADCSDEEWERAIAVNQTGVFYGMRAVIPALRRAGGGSIINVSSVFGINGAKDCLAYVAAKHAVVGMTKSAALSHGVEGIRVNAIAPGLVMTPMLEAEIAAGLQDTDATIARQAIRRMGWPADVSPAVLYLASDETSFVTGTVMLIDAGSKAR